MKAPPRLLYFMIIGLVVACISLAFGLSAGSCMMNIFFERGGGLQ